MSKSLPEWAQKLQEFNSKPSPLDATDNLSYHERLGKEQSRLFDPCPSTNIIDDTFTKIPAFYTPKTDPTQPPITQKSLEELEIEKETQPQNINKIETASSTNTIQANSHILAVSEITRELFLDNMEERLLSEHDLDCLFENMLQLIKEYHATSNPNKNSENESSPSTTQNNHCWMSYEIFRELKQSLPPRAHKFFTASVFRKFPMNSNGHIRGDLFHEFVSLALNLLHQYITLCRYDISSNMLPVFNGESKSKSNVGLSQEIDWDGTSYLTEADLEIFVGDQIEMIPSLNRIDEQFHPYYVYHAVRKFIFTLNPDDNVRKQIPITKILCSAAFQEFNEFRFSSQINENDKSNDSSEITEFSQELMQKQVDLAKSNWFSCENALRVYKMYLELDCDHNGTLSQKEMLQYNGSSLSNLCIQRIFQYKKTWDQEMDYKGFLNFVLAVECKQYISSLYYWWDILDLDECGYLTPLTLHTLFRSVQKKMGIFGIDPINIEDVISEIFDMVHPKEMNKITKQDLIDSKMYRTVIDILTDVKGFWEYDNRESMVAEQSQ